MDKTIRNPLSWIILSFGLIAFSIIFEGLVAIPGIILLIAGIVVMGTQLSVHVWQFVLISLVFFSILIGGVEYLLRDSEDFGTSYLIFLVFIILNTIFIVTRVISTSIKKRNKKK